LEVLDTLVCWWPVKVRLARRGLGPADHNRAAGTCWMYTEHDGRIGCCESCSSPPFLTVRVLAPHDPRSVTRAPVHPVGGEARPLV